MFVRPPNFVDEGAMHFHGGRFIMPFAGPGASKEASQKAKKIITIAASVFVILAFAVAAFLSYQPNVQLPLEQELLSAMGKNATEVAAALELDRDDMQLVEPGLYFVNGGYKYAGVTFDILLRFEENEGLLRAFGYEATYQANVRKAAKNIAAVAKRLLGDEIVLSDGTVMESERGQIRTYLEGTGTIALDQTARAFTGGALTEYIEHLENAEYYEGRSGEYLLKRAICYEDLHIAYDKAAEEAMIKVWFSIETDRTKD